MAPQGKLAAALAALSAVSAASGKPWAAELRRWEGSADCKGKFEVLNQDQMEQCTPKAIPAPASFWVEQVNDTAYASYHHPGVIDCSGNGTLLEFLAVGQCTSFGDYSQMRAWVEAPPDASCAVPGDCGRAYQACCAGAAATQNQCQCHLRNGTGTAGARDCGACGKAYLACCVGFQIQGHPCGCDIKHNPAVAEVVV